MRRNTPKDYALALYKATREVSAQDLKSILKQFAGLLFRAGQMKQVDEIIAELVKYDKQQAGIIDIKITSARPLTAKLVNEIKKVFGTKVESVEEVQAELIGGIKIQTEDTIFDASLKKQLQSLKQALT